MYAERDGWTCHLCGEAIVHEIKDERLNLSLDHLLPRSKGGSDYPSNLAASHVSCNKARGNRDVPDSSPHSLNDSVNEAVPDSPPEGNGGGREGIRESASRALAVVEAPPETAQTVLGGYIDWRRAQGVNGIDRRTIGLLAKQLGQAFEAGHPADVIKRGLVAWHERDQHPSTLASFIDVEARGGQARASPTRVDQQRQQRTQTDDLLTMWATSLEEGGNPDDTPRMAGRRAMAEHGLPRPADQP
jgi:hypothetical protein